MKCFFFIRAQHRFPHAPELAPTNAQSAVSPHRPVRFWHTCLIGMCALAWAQAPPAQPAAEVTTTDAPASFSSQVNLVVVPVVVRDKDGRPTGTLKKEDFQLFDKGKPQMITRFSVEGRQAPIKVTVEPGDQVEGAAAPAASIGVASIFTAFLFDDLHLDSGDLLFARQAAERYLNEPQDASARTGIFTTSGKGNVDFTDDKEKLIQGLRAILPRPLRLENVDDCLDLTYYMADQIDRGDQRAMDIARREVLQRCPPPMGVDPISYAESQVRSVLRPVVSTGEHDARLSLGTVEEVIRRLSVMPGQRNLILVSPGFVVTLDNRHAETEVMDRAIRARVTLSSLNARGVYAIIPGGDASQRTVSFDGAKVQYQQEGYLAEEVTLGELSDGTGGHYFHNSNDLAAGIRQLATPPEFVYLLGFSPQNLKYDGAFHALKVNLKVAGQSIQARRGYYAPSHATSLEDQAKEEIREALFSREEMNDIPVDLHTQFFKTNDTSAKLAVITRLDMHRVRFQKSEDRNRNTVTVTAGLFDRNGNFISGLQKIVDLRLRDETMQKVLNGGISVRSNFDVTSGTYVIRVVVRDAEGQTMSAKNGAVEIP
jgi:VWFA-related protein